MNRRLLIVCTTLIVFGLLISPCSIAPETKSVQSMMMFQVPKFTVHYRAPRDEDVERILRDEMILRPGADVATIQSAVQEFKQKWFERNPTTPTPHKLRQLLNKERGEARALAQVQDSQIQILVVPVEFPGEDTFEWCGSTVTTSGPLHNQTRGYRIWKLGGLFPFLSQDCSPPSSLSEKDFGSFQQHACHYSCLHYPANLALASSSETSEVWQNRSLRQTASNPSLNANMVHTNVTLGKRSPFHHWHGTRTCAPGRSTGCFHLTLWLGIHPWRFWPSWCDKKSIGGKPLTYD